MKRPEGREVFERLARRSDVFVTGFSTETCQKLGMDYETLRDINPGIIYCQATGFGAVGPYAALPTHGLMMNALGRRPTFRVGAQDRLEVEGIPPDAPGFIVGSLFAAFAVSAALYRREREGIGAYIDIACSDAVIAMANLYVVAALNASKLTVDSSVPSMPEGAPVGGARLDYYLTSDDRIVFFCCIELKFWRSFCNAVGRENLIETHDGRAADFGADDPDLAAELRSLFRSRTLKEWTDLFVALKVPASPALDVTEALGDPHFAARDLFVMEDHPTAGPLLVAGSPVRVGGDSFRIAHHAPSVGEHSDEVLLELGYSSAEIERLRASEVL
jgi:formyl-CoA transferase